MQAQPNKFRFGFMPTEVTTREQLVTAAHQGEDFGYDVMFLGDHLGDLGVFPALSTAADATKTLRVGPLVLANDLRSPVLVANDAATLDILSGGRLELGLGAGYRRDEYSQVGIPYDSPGVRVRRLAEAVEIIKGYFHHEPFSFHGNYYQVDELTGPLQPVQKPHPPLIIGGGGRQVLSLAAREADIVSFATRKKADGSIDARSTTREALAEKTGWVREAAGDASKPLEIMAYVWFMKVTDHQSEADQTIDMIHKFLIDADPESQITPEQVRASPYGMAGSEDYLVEKALALREQFGVSYWVFLGNPLDAARLVRRLSGH
jgi:probable F420-dependent oxidoreductase